MTTPLKIGFIGGSGHHYLRQVIVTDAVDVAVAPDGHDDAAARKFFESLQAAHAGVSIQWVDSGEMLLDTFRPDVLSVGAVYGFNGDWNAAALRRDIATVSDKPVAASWKQLENLKKLAAQNPQRILLTEFDFHCRPDFRAARAAVKSGAIGEVALVTAQKSYRFGTRAPWYADRQSYGGTLLWIASHGIDAVQFVTGKNFARFTGAQGNVSQPTMGTMEDHVAVLATLEGGGTAVVHADFLRPKAAATHGDDRLRVAGSLGIVEVRDGRAVLMTDDQPPIDITDREANIRSIGPELLTAAMGHASEYFSTSQSLDMAEVLLRARDAVDGRIWA